MSSTNTTILRHGKTTVCSSIELALAPAETFALFVEELTIALTQTGMGLEPGENGRITEGEREVASIISWQPDKLIRLHWHQSEQYGEELTEVEMHCEPIDGGTRIALSHHSWGALIADAREQVGWFASEVATPLLKAMTPTGLGDWLTDRQARRPSGPQSRAVYRDPLYHYPNFRVLLTELALTPDDYLLEVGCGGGAFLKDALQTGCRAAAIDHSTDMVQLARQVNHDAIAEGRLEVQRASADHLPFPDTTFTCATMTAVLGFLPDPVAALREIRRVLRQGGRLVMLGSDPAMRGTPAAPEPMASRLHFYTDDELRQLALEAGFAQAQVVRHNLEPFARQVGVPAEHLPLFMGPGAPFLLAQKG